MERGGQILNGRYHVERTLGRGGMGAVYLARQSDLGDFVAIKEMVVAQIEPLIREACIHQFRAEARILNRLHHPGLPRVYDYFEQDSNQFLVMDYIEGGTLADHVSRNNAGEADIIEWARQLCDVLEYLHNHNPPVIFKDVKPTNIMLARDGTLRLIDFGIAKVFDPTRGDDTLTVLKGSGSDGFAPIEQYGQGKTDIRSDIYGLGATLYTLLTRKVPPSAPDRAGGDDPLVPLARLRADVSERTVSAIEWMLQVNRDARPRSISEVVDSLGLTPALGVPRTTLPARIRRMLREEFHHFFPSHAWFPRDVLPLEDLSRFLSFLHPELPAPLIGIWGDPGSGKTRMMAELRIMVKDQVDVLPVVQAGMMLRHQPFGCLLAAVRVLLRRKIGPIMTKVAGQLDSQVLYEAATALPELRTVTPHGAHVRRSSAEMTRSLLTTLMAIFTQAVAERPALLMVDDAQWADPATMRFLDQLRASPVGGRIPMVVAWHPDNEEEPHREFIERWNHEGEAALVPVPPLSSAEVRSYIEFLIPPIAEVGVFVPDLFELCEGNPLRLEELLRLMVVRRVLRDGPGKLRIEDWRPEHMPRTMEETVRRRLEHLPVDSQVFLSQAAAVGLIFNVETLRELSGEPEPILREALQRAREACFVRLSAETPGTFEFLSEATRQVFYDRLSQVDRTRLHRTLGILEEDRSAVTGDISHSELHFAMAGDLDHTLEDLARVTHDFLSPRHIEIVLGEMPHVKHWDRSTELNPEQEQWALQSLNMLVRSVRSKGSFGGQTYVTEMAQESLAGLILPLLDEVGPLTVTCAETVFSMNGKNLNPALAPADLQSLLARHKLSGLQMRPGLTRAELVEWVNLLMRSRDSIHEEGGWTAALAAHGIQNVTVSEMIYVGVAESELFDPTRIKEFGTITVRESRGPAPEPGNLEDIEAVLAGMERGPVDEQAVMARLDAIRQMLTDIKRASAPVIVKEEEKEPEPDPGPPIPPEVLDMARELMANAHPKAIARMLSMVRDVEVPLAEFLQRTPELLLQELEQGDANTQVAAVAALQALGRRAVPPLLRYLSHSDHTRARTEAMHVLRRVANDCDVLLTRRLIESRSAEESCRLLAAMAVAGLPWSANLSVLLHSASPEVRRNAYSFLQRSDIPKPDKARILGDIIKSDHPGLIADAVRAAGSLRLPGLISTLSATLKRSFEKTADTTLVQREVCYALGRIGLADVLPLLRSVVYPGLTQTKRDPEVRSAALWAIGRIPGEEADEVLERAALDRDPLLRSVAKVAVDTRNSTTTDPDVLAQLEQ